MNAVDECKVKFTCSDECFLFPRWGDGVLFKDSVLKGPGVTNDTGCNNNEYSLDQETSCI